ncbi:hypothetical protein QYM36_015410, partial [Artemia franciscana]
ISRMSDIKFQPIGYVSTWFKVKNGTPRQGGLSNLTRGSVKILDTIYNNPEHSLEGLLEYSHVWLIWVFHENKGEYKKAKIAPPRLGGKRIGVFSTRTPHRMNPIGLTLAKLERVEGSVLHLSGLDLLDGTPVLDIKPFIPEYDTAEGLRKRNLLFESELSNVNSEGLEPVSEVKDFDSACEKVSLNDDAIDCQNSHLSISKDLISDHSSEIQVKDKDSQYDLNRQENISIPDRCFVSSSNCALEDDSDPSVTNENGANVQTDLNSSNINSCVDLNLDSVSNDNSDVRVANWLSNKNKKRIPVKFSNNATTQLHRFSSGSGCYMLRYLKDINEAKNAISHILGEDPRSIYRKKKCVDRLYFVMVDNMHVTAWYDDESIEFEVLRIMPKILRQRN